MGHKSRWFTRGWTLQELIAPRSLRLYSKEWALLGMKSQPWMIDALSDITGVPKQVLQTGDASGCCVAQRMGWASKRRTTRIEDRAYCLLGLFDVNMPLLYGERENAFARLRKEIMETSDDDSILRGKQARIHTRLFEVFWLDLPMSFSSPQT